MAIKDIDKMTAPLSAKGGKEVAMSDPHPDAERSDMMDMMSEKYFGKAYDKLTPKEIELLEENWDELISQREQPEGIMQLASHSGDDVTSSAILWFIDTYGQEGLQSIMAGETDMQSVINAYMDAKTEMN